MAGVGGFRGPRGMMRVAVGGKGGVAATTNSPTPPKPRSRCSSPTRAHYQKPLTSSSSSSSSSSSACPHNDVSTNKGGGGGGGFSTGYYGLESPFSPYYGWPDGEEYEWVSSDDDEEVHDVSEEDVSPLRLLPRDEGFLGPVPSPEEVHSAVSALTQVFGTSSYSQLVRDKYAYSADAVDQISSPNRMLRRVASVGAQSDWLEPSANLLNTTRSRSFGSDRVYDAFHLLQTDPSVQRMVISISSDRAVWDAVLNNEAVRELRQSYSSDVNVSPPRLEGSGESAGKTNPALNVIVWMLDSTRAKFTDIFETLSKLVNDLFKQPEEAKKATAPPEPEQPDQFMKIMGTSFQLSILVLLIVAITRFIKARS